MIMSESILELKKLTKMYGRQKSVDEVSLKLPKGEFLSFLGPSGSGKTTTLNMIAGLTDPTDGEILLQEKPITALKTYKRNIGMVFQNYSLFPHMSVAKNIAFPLEMRRYSRSDVTDKVTRALDLVGLETFKDRLPSQLSGGQQQRVALARAMVFEPPLLLMDEPLGALDKQLREHMQLEIRRLHQRIGATIIYVTHDQEEALTMSDRIAVFNHGKIEQLGSPEELYKLPSTRFVAGFIGQTNLIDGHVKSMNGKICKVIAEGLEFLTPSQPGMSSGQAVTVAVRPECIHIGNAASGAEGEHNLLQARVEETIFFGSARRYLLSVGGLRLMATETIGHANSRSIPLAETIPVHWAVGSSVVVPN